MRPSESKYLSVRNLRLHLRCWPAATPDPDSPLRVILHGWSDTSATWQRLVDHLPEDWNIVAPDWRGCGLSERAGDTYIFADYLADFDGILRELGSPEVDLIGHSMGGQIAALYAGLRPETVRRLAVLDALFLPPSDPSKAPARLREWLDEVHLPVADRIYPTLSDLAQRTQRYHAGLDDAGALQVAQAWSEALEDGQVRLLADPRHRQRGPLLYRDEEALAVFAEITAPTLILDADRSNLAQMCPADIRQRRIDAIRKHTRAKLAECGHMMHFDAPEQTATALVDFLR